MSSSNYGAVGVVNRTRTLFGQVMWFVAATAGLFALGAYLGRNLGNGLAFVFFILAFVCLIGLRFAIRSSAGLGIALLFGVGLLLGLGMSPTLVYYANADPQALWEAGCDGPVHRRLRRLRLRHPYRSVRHSPCRLLGAACAHRVRRRVDLRAHSRGCAHLLDPRVGRLRRSHRGRLPAAPPIDGSGLGTAYRRIDLFGCAQRVLVLPAAVRRQGPGLSSALPVTSGGGAPRNSGHEPAGDDRAEAGEESRRSRGRSVTVLRVRTLKTHPQQERGTAHDHRSA